MGLVEEQHVFLGHVSELVRHARDLGFIVTAGELFRTPEQQRIHVRAGRSRTMASQHMKRLAIDLNFLVPEPGAPARLCYDKTALQPLGDFWERLDPANRWGGNWKSFKDTPHFERREGFMNGHEGNGQANGASGNGHAGNGQAVVLEAPEAVASDPRARRLMTGAVGERRANLHDDVETVQHLLNRAAEAGRFALAEPLKADGDFGGKTGAAIFAYQREHLRLAEVDGIVDPDGTTLRALVRELDEGFSATLLGLVMLAASPEDVARFAGPIAACCTRFGIDTPLRQAHFLAQIGHESGQLRFQQEIWGPTAAQKRYEGRADLGNLQAGDGKRFMGRGLIQLTGRSNYGRYGRAIGREQEILASPEIVASDLDLCVGVAGWYWTQRGINALADHDDVTAVTRAINGGLNGIADRRALLARAKAAYGLG